MRFFKRMSVLLTVAALLTAALVFPMNVSAAESDNYVAAHWKFQDEEGYYTGSVEDDDLTFIDLTGNGNDLEVRSEGFGDELDIFEWDEGVELNDGGYTAGSSLRFGNTWDKALSVDPYEPSQTEYSGAFVSGKYFQTVDGAPLNNVDSTTGWAVEIIFKIDEEWNNNYNRYTGLFSRQGVVESQDEPAFSMALTELISGASDGYIGTEGTTGLQYVHVDVNENKTNYELMNGEIYGEQWIHFMVTSDGGYTEVFINGESVFAAAENNEIYITDSLFSWEVGVGRKTGFNKDTNQDHATMNPKHPEGLIRRLFCGSISEIRFTMNYMDIEDSLLYINNSNEDDTSDTVSEPLLETNNIYNYWTEELVNECYMGANQTKVEFTEEGAKLSGITGSNIDPYVSINLRRYVSLVHAEPLKCEEYPFVVFKVKAVGTTGDCELFYTSIANGNSVEPNYYDPNGEWQYLVFDLSYYDSWIAERSPISVRLDWSMGYEGAPEDAYMVVSEIALFKTEEEANVYAGIEPETKPEKTEAPETEAPETQAPETQAATDAETQAPAEGCASVMGIGAVAVLAAVAAFVAIKKKD